MNSVLDHISDMLPFFLFSVPVIILSRIISIKQMRKKNINTTIHHEIGVILFLIFIAGLLSQTIIPRSNEGITGIDIENFSEFFIVNLIPGKTFMSDISQMQNGNFDIFLIFFIGNIVMFIPVGFAVPLLWRMPIIRAFFAGAVLSLLIELIQLPLPRCTDIDDLILNSVGGIIGTLLFLIVRKIFPKFTDQFRVKACG